MGWLWLCVIGGAAGLFLWRAGVVRAAREFVGAALLLGAAGYAWQQHATLTGHTVKADTEKIDVDPGMVAFRDVIMPGLPGDSATLATADDQLRRGDAGAAARGLLDVIGREPNDAALWAGLGSAIAARDGGHVSPAAQYAFRRALSLAPTQPGPPFFLGLAYIQTGEFGAAKQAWLQALALSPRSAPYRMDIAERLAMIDEFQAMSAGRRPPVAPPNK